MNKINVHINKASDNFDYLITNAFEQISGLEDKINKLDNDNSVGDCIFLCGSNIELSNFDGYKIIYLIVNKDNDVEKQTLIDLSNKYGDKLKIFYVSLDDAVRYNKIISDLENVDIQDIDKILIEEFGKQEFKKLTNRDKKIKKLKTLLDDKELINEWMKTTGYDELVKSIISELLFNYDQIIKSHAKIELSNIYDKIISNNQYDISNIIESIKLIVDILEIDLKKINDTIINIEENDNITNIMQTNQDVTISLNSEQEPQIISNDDTSMLNKILSHIDNQIENISFDGVDEDSIYKYFDFFNKYNELKEITKIEIMNKRNEIIKKKLLISFDDKLFIEQMSKNIINIEFVKECVECTLVLNPNNFNLLINFARNHATDLISIIINNFININYDFGKTYVMNLDDFIPTLSFIVDNYMTNTSENSKLIYKFMQLYTNNNTDWLITFTHIFNTCIREKIYLDLQPKNVVFYNLGYNLSIMASSAGTQVLEPIDNTEFTKITSCSIKIFDTIMSTLYQETKKSGSDNSDKEFSENEKSDEESDKESNEDSDEKSDEESQESDEELILDVGNNSKIQNIIGDIFNHIKESVKKRHINNNVLMKMAEYYLTKGQNYKKSIQLFEQDRLNKNFTKVYNKLVK